MVGHSWRRPAVDALNAKGVSQNRACWLIGITANGYRYQPQPSTLNQVLVKKMQALALRHPRWGMPRLFLTLHQEYGMINHKRVRRLYRLQSLQLRPRHRRRRFAGIRQPLPVPVAPNEIWAMDFMSDFLAHGRKYRCLNVEDLCTRELLESEVDFSIGGARVTRVLDMLVALRGVIPGAIQTDNGPEFTSHALLLWCQKNRVTHYFTDPGKPIQNALIESLNGRMRDECFSSQLMEDLEEARTCVAHWRNHYNQERPHSSLNNQTPNEYLKSITKKLTLESAK